MHAPDFLGIFLAATHGAGRDVVMAVQVLGGAMDADVYAQGMRLLIQGRGKSVVGDGDDAFGPASLATATRSVNDRVGLTGVSSMIRRVSVRMAAARAFISVLSTLVVPPPKRGRTTPKHY